MADSPPTTEGGKWTLFLAGQYEQAAHAAREQGLKASEWGYIRDIRDVRGFRRGKVYVVGTAAERRDYADVIDELNMRGVEVVHA